MELEQRSKVQLLKEWSTGLHERDHCRHKTPDMGTWPIRAKRPHSQNLTDTEARMTDVSSQTTELMTLGRPQRMQKLVHQGSHTGLLSLDHFLPFCRLPKRTWQI